MSAPRNLRKLTDESEALNRVQEYTAQALAPLIGSNIINGTLLEDLELTNTATKVSHKLGRKPRGYIIVRASAAEQIFDSGLDKAHLNLQASGNVTVSLWVF